MRIQRNSLGANAIINSNSICLCWNMKCKTFINGYHDFKKKKKRAIENKHKED